MLSVKAIYNGHNLRLLENIEINSPQEVIITFLEKDGDDISGKIITIFGFPKQKYGIS